MGEYIIKHIVREKTKYETVHAESAQEAYEQLKESYDGELYAICIAKVVNDWIDTENTEEKKG